MSPQLEIVPKPPDRFQIRSGILDGGEPFIKPCSNLTMQEITLPLPLAPQKAAEINLHVVQMMALAQQQTQHQKHGIVRPNGQPV
jgi:hypothetical protein